jgi:hypothetical protein
MASEKQMGVIVDRLLARQVWPDEQSDDSPDVVEYQWSLHIENTRRDKNAMNAVQTC